jgi:hypothetical protein
MIKAIANVDLLKPLRSKAETKADVTNNIARNITETEIAKRDAKTARLREARLAMEALDLESKPPAPAKKPAAKSRAKK